MFTGWSYNYHFEPVFKYLGALYKEFKFTTLVKKKKKKKVITI